MATKKEKDSKTSAEAPAEAAGEAGQAEGPQFGIQRIFVKDVSLECPHSPDIFLSEWEPELNIDLSTDGKNVLADGVREVVLTLTVTVKIKEKVAFLVELKQAGIFSVPGFEEEELKHLVGSYCPSILYPYAREAVTDLVVKAGFPPLYLAPVNFDLLYERQLAEQAGTH